jgi:hypothetical protein
MRETDSLVESESSDGGLEQLSYLLIEVAIAATCITEYQSDAEVSDGAFTPPGHSVAAIQENSAAPSVEVMLPMLLPSTAPATSACVFRTRDLHRASPASHDYRIIPQPPNDVGRQADSTADTVEEKLTQLGKVSVQGQIHRTAGGRFIR